MFVSLSANMRLLAHCGKHDQLPMFGQEIKKMPRIRATTSNRDLAGRSTKAALLTALRDGSSRGQVAVLAVHVVGPRAGVVAQPHAEVLDLLRLLLEDLRAWKSQMSDCQQFEAFREQSLEAPRHWTV